MVNKKKWVPAVSIDAAIFQIPSKNSKVLTIKQPPAVLTSLTNDAVQNIRTGDAARAPNTDANLQWPSLNGKENDRPLLVDGADILVQNDRIAAHESFVTREDPAGRLIDSRKSNKAAADAHSAQQPADLNNTRSSSITTNAAPTEHAESSRKFRSNLDVYAHKYVPYWLKAINESFVITNHAPQIQRPDYDAYRATFAGAQMLRQLPPAELPPTYTCVLQDGNLKQGVYQPYWYERLQNEYAAQAAQNDAYTLYGIDVIPAQRIDPLQNIYQFKVPGLREFTPRIDLGDILLIRPFFPSNLHTVATEAQEWSIHRHGLAPRSIGVEHHAVVWSLLRRDEIVLVKLGKPMLRDTKCNVIVPLQIHKNIPAWRAINTIGTSILLETGSWLNSMLFPLHGVQQNQLSRGTFGLDSSWIDASLNFEQKRAVQAIVDAKYGVIPYLVSGPPGTGKTKTMVETVLQLLRNPRQQAPHILVCAPSDAAADTLLIRLSNYLNRDELFRLNNWTRLATEVPGEVRPYCYLDGNQLYALPDFDTMMAFQVVVTTCRDANVLISAGLTNFDLASIAIRMLRAISSTSIDNLNPLHWTALILDEAAQATEPEALIPMSVLAPFEETRSLSQNQVPQIIMAGDEFQLGPRLISKAMSGHAAKFDTAGLEKSLFQRLFERPLYAQHPLSRSNGLRPLTREMLPITQPSFANLIRNYRSNPSILSTSSALFYSDTLIPERPDTSPAILSWPRWSRRKDRKAPWPVMFHQNAGPDRVESISEGNGSGSGALLNDAEARIALNLVESLLNHVNNEHSDHLYAEDIIIMSPFRAQVNHLRQHFRAAGHHTIRIGPLEAFQGLESRVVVLCTTRTRLGQHPHPLTKFVDEDKARNLGVIDEPKSFNVAMTRAQEALIVIGNAEVLSVTRDPCWLSFLRFCVRNGLCVPSGPGQVSWFGRNAFAGAGAGVGMGKLEKALIYAEGLQESMTEGGEDSSLPDASNGRDGESFKFKLRGAMIDLDERMWEMQVDDEERQAISAEEEEDDSLDDELDEDDFEGVDDYEHDNSRVGEPVY